MFRLLNKRKAQSTIEYVVLIIIIIGALITIQVYIKRGVQGRMKQASDDIGDQFSPGNTNVFRTMTTNSSTDEVFGITAQGVSKSTLRALEKTTTNETSNIVNVDQEYWGNK